MAETDINNLVTRLAAEPPSYRKKVERTLRNVQAVLAGPRLMRRLAGDQAKARQGERALRLELALLDGLREGQVKQVEGPAGERVWWLDPAIVQRWFTEKELES